MSSVRVGASVVALDRHLLKRINTELRNSSLFGVDHQMSPQVHHFFSADQTFSFTIVNSFFCLLPHFFAGLFAIFLVVFYICHSIPFFPFFLFVLFFMLPVVVETEQKDAPPQAVTSSGEVSPPEQLSHQLDPRPELITTCAGRMVKPPHRLKDYVCD